MRTLTLAAVVAALLAPVAASAAEPMEDWRAAACIDQGRWSSEPRPPEQAVASGASTLVASNRVAVDGLPGVQVGVDRLDFSGVTCEILYVDGALPRDSVLDVSRDSWCAAFDRAVDGKEQLDAAMCSFVGGPSRLYFDGRPGSPRDTIVLAVTAFRAHYSGVMRAGRNTPARWVGKTLTSDHTGSTWEVAITGTTAVRRGFDRSRATDRAARAAYAKRVARAQRTYDERVATIEASSRSLDWKAWKVHEARVARRAVVALARKRQRLALDGFRLLVRDFRSSDRGTLPPAA